MSNRKYDLEPFCVRARGFVASGRLEDAINLYDDVICVAPDCPMGYAERGTVFAMMNQNERAMEDLEKAFALGYAEASAYSSAATICLQTQQYDKAMLYFSKAIESDSEYPFTYYNRANLNYTLGNKTEAVADLERLLRMGGDDDFRQLVQQRLVHVKASQTP